ncbi:hypothetical protein C8F01DRAFT_1236910 [Mycena amicta]|nr:hypothetical protein C8F01DRAFT_1236910 [Mycena amicta]
MSLCTRLVTHSHLGLHFPAAAVLYIDIDIDTHRGDGVEEVFYTTDRASFQIRRVLFRGRALRRTCIPAGHGASNRPTTIVLQCGADSLSGENLKLGDFNLSLSGHAVCVQFIRKCNLPLVFLGGGGVCYVYTVKNGGRTSPGPYLPSVWTLENDIREEAMACWIGFGNVRAPAFGTVRAPIELHFRGGMTGRQGTSWMRSRRGIHDLHKAECNGNGSAAPRSRRRTAAARPTKLGQASTANDERACIPRRRIVTVLRRRAAMVSAWKPIPGAAAVMTRGVGRAGRGAVRERARERELPVDGGSWSWKTVARAPRRRGCGNVGAGTRDGRGSGKAATAAQRRRDARPSAATRRGMSTSTLTRTWMVISEPTAR